MFVGESAAALEAKPITLALVSYSGILRGYAGLLKQVKDFAAAVEGGRPPPPPVTTYQEAEAKIHKIMSTTADARLMGTHFVVGACARLRTPEAYDAATTIEPRYDDFVSRLAACAGHARGHDAICLLEDLTDAADSLAQAAAAAARLTEIADHVESLQAAL
jgi:hypothetical protein